MTDGKALAIDGHRRVEIWLVVAALHLAVLIWLGLSVAPILPDMTTRAVDIMLVKSPALSPIPSEKEMSAGEAPAAPSRIHTPPTPRPEVVELTAPQTLAPIQPLVLGVSSLPSPAASGAGGAGTGDGSGTGPDAGEGGDEGGGGRGAELIQGPVDAVITRDVQSGTLTEAGVNHVVLRCRIRLSRRLENCRVIGEHPRPSGFRTVALSRAREFRFRPPERGGRRIDRAPITVAIAFPAPSDSDPDADR